MKLPIFYTVSMYRRKVTVKCVTLVLLWIKLWFHHESYGLKCSMFIKDEFKIGLLEQQEQKQDSKKKKQKKVVCLKKKKGFHVKNEKIFQNKFVLACDALMSFFYCEQFRCVCVQQNVIGFSFKEKKISETIVPNSKGTFFLELQCVSCVK